MHDKHEMKTQIPRHGQEVHARLHEHNNGNLIKNKNKYLIVIKN